MLMKPMIPTIAAAVVVVTCLVAPADPSKKAATTRFDQFKALAGDWNDAGPDGKSSTIRFKLSSGGSVVEEVYFPDTNHEMVNMITKDGSDINLVHYCMLGNQPRMKAPNKVSGKSVAFKFVSAGNLKSKNDMYMRNVTFTFIDADTLKESWVSYNAGKQAGPPQVFMHKRKKE